MLKLGCWILTTWTALNCLASLKIVIETLLFEGHTPALFLLLSEADVRSLPSNVVATIDSIALFANGLNIAFCIVALGLVWSDFSKLRTGKLSLLLAGFTMAWLAGFMADVAVGYAAPWVNAISLAIIALGFAATGLGLKHAVRSGKVGAEQRDQYEVAKP